MYNTSRMYVVSMLIVQMMCLMTVYLRNDRSATVNAPVCSSSCAGELAVVGQLADKPTQSKAKQRCVMGVGMCLYAQLVQTKNK